VIHNYRWRLSLGDGEEQHDELEQWLAEAPEAFAQAVIDVDRC
jgi:hypothetical protein